MTLRLGERSWVQHRAELRVSSISSMWLKDRASESKRVRGSIMKHCILVAVAFGCQSSRAYIQKFSTTCVSISIEKCRFLSSAKNASASKYSSAAHTPGFIGFLSICCTPIDMFIEVPAST
jgi:hypothetical protein